MGLASRLSLRQRLWASGILEHSQCIQLAGRECHDLSGQGAQLGRQTGGHIVCRNLIEQTNDVLLGGTAEGAGSGVEPTDTGPDGAQGVEVVHAHVSADEFGIHAVHGDEVVGDVGERQGSEAVVPFVGEALAAGELECGVRGPGVGLYSAEERADVFQIGRGRVAVFEIREKAEEETGRTIEEYYLGTKVEVGVGRFGLSVSLTHVCDYVGKVVIGPGGFGHHREKG